jgi:hypothetical protein
VRIRTALIRSAAAGAVVVGVAGCATQAQGPVERAAAAREAWLAGGVDTYSFTVTSSCGERLMIGTFAVHVTGGEVTSVEGLDEPGRVAAGVASLPDVVPTIGGLLDRLVALDGSEVREATFDPETGVPTHVLLDPMPDAIDDEECYDLADFAPQG